MKTLVMAELWGEHTKFRKVFIGDIDSWPGDVRLEFSSDGSCILTQIENGAADQIRLDKSFVQAVVFEMQEWLLRLTPWAERRERELFERYQTGLITRQELITILSMEEYKDMEKGDFQAAFDEAIKSVQHKEEQ